MENKGGEGGENLWNEIIRSKERVESKSAKSK